MITIDDVLSMTYPKIGVMPYVCDFRSSLATMFVHYPTGGRTLYVAEIVDNQHNYTGFPIERMRASISYNRDINNREKSVLLVRAFQRINQGIELQCLNLLTPFYRQNIKPTRMLISITNLSVHSIEESHRYKTSFSLDVGIGAV